MAIINIDFNKKAYKLFILSKGIKGQLGILQEEMAELTKDISKYNREKLELKDLAEEMADVMRVWLQVYSLIQHQVDEEFKSKQIFEED